MKKITGKLFQRNAGEIFQLKDEQHAKQSRALFPAPGTKW